MADKKIETHFRFSPFGNFTLEDFEREKPFLE